MTRKNMPSGIIWSALSANHMPRSTDVDYVVRCVPSRGDYLYPGQSSSTWRYCFMDFRSGSSPATPIIRYLSPRCLHCRAPQAGRFANNQYFQRSIPSSLLQIEQCWSSQHSSTILDQLFTFCFRLSLVPPNRFKLKFFQVSAFIQLDSQFLLNANSRLRLKLCRISTFIQLDTQ